MRRSWSSSRRESCRRARSPKLPPIINRPPVPDRSDCRRWSRAKRSRSNAIRIIGTKGRLCPAWFSKSCPTPWCACSNLKKATSTSCRTISSPTCFPGLKIIAPRMSRAYAGTTFQYIGINLTHPILKNVKVRRALAYAIDRESLVRHLLKDTGDRRRRRPLAAQLGLRRQRPALAVRSKPSQATAR